MRKSDAAAQVVLVDKPEGPTSHDVVRMVRQCLSARRVGHAGTLDPFASGLLLVCVGWSTRLTEYFHLLSKRYEARVTLGTRTDTDDRTGRVIATSDAWRRLTRADVVRSAARFEGPQDQLPPDYSAKKVDGRRAYRAARSGSPLSLAPARVDVHALRLIDFRPPDLDLALEVSTGTYVRALARDLGDELGCHAHLSALRRTGIGPFSAADALGLEELTRGEPSRKAWMSPLEALAWLPTRVLTLAELGRIRHGQAIPVGEANGRWDGPVALAFGGRLVAVSRPGPVGLHPEKVFAEQE